MILISSELVYQYELWPEKFWLALWRAYPDILGSDPKSSWIFDIFKTMINPIKYISTPWENTTQQPSTQLCRQQTNPWLLNTRVAICRNMPYSVGIQLRFRSACVSYFSRYKDALDLQPPILRTVKILVLLCRCICTRHILRDNFQSLAVRNAICQEACFG